jgi:hypothetical protein
VPDESRSRSRASLLGSSLRTRLGVVVEWSEAAVRLQGDVIGKLDGPRVLFDAWTTGTVSDGDLHNLIPNAHGAAATIGPSSEPGRRP